MMLTGKTSRRVAAAVTSGALLGTVLVGGASAGPGDTVLNPGPFTLTLEGDFFNLAGNGIDLPSSSDPVQCNDDVNNDTAVQPAAAPQDTNIDFDGGGVGPVDAQCNAGGGNPASLDNSEAKAGFQAKTPIQLSGSVDEDGNVSIPQASVNFPTFFVFANPGGVIDINITAAGDGTGFLDPGTGLTSLNVPIGIRVVQAFFNIDCTISPINLALTTDAAAPENSGPLAVNPVGYNTTDGTVTVTGNTFTVPAAAVTPGGNPNTTQAICDTISSSFGELPADSGESAAQFLAEGDVIFQSGGVAENTIEGTVTNDGAEVVPGVTVTLMSAFPDWTIVDTAVTDAGGDYAFTGMPDGDYAVRFFDGQGRYQRTWYQGQNTYATSTPISVSGMSTVTVDQQLADQPSGSIGGRTFDEDGDPLAGMQVQVFDADGFYASKTTGVDGWYTIYGVPPGDYTVRFSDPTNTYAKQWYQNKVFGWNANTVTVGGAMASASAPMYRYDQPTYYDVTLSGANEVPPVASGYTGQVRVQVDEVEDQVCVDSDLNTGGAPITGYHIHDAPVGVNGPIVVNFSGQPDICVNVSDALATAINAEPQEYYLNVHTGAFPGGGMRGQLG